jgi:hypothetical protein
MAKPDGQPHDLVRQIEVLGRHEVEYLLVGGATAWAYGANRFTYDAEPTALCVES